MLKTVHSCGIKHWVLTVVTLFRHRCYFDSKFQQNLCAFFNTQNLCFKGSFRGSLGFKHGALGKIEAFQPNLASSEPS